MPYSYDDFTAAVNRSGLMGEFSKADLDLARQYPEAGMSILGYKQDIHRATTPEAKRLAHSAAEEVRRRYGSYSSGQLGDQYLYAGRGQGQVDGILDRIGSFQTGEDPYRQQYQDALDRVGSFGEFSYGDAPAYENRYQEQQKALLDSIINREGFSWSKEEDPLWPVYRKEYLREGERATADALGQAAAASGGRPSTAAATAAAQAGDYYATKLNDIIPTLYRQAYDNYLDEYQMKLQDLGAVNGQEQLEYQKYLDRLGQYNTDRGFSYQKYLDRFTRQLQGLDALEGAQRLGMDRQAADFSILQGQLGAFQGQEQVDYQKYLDRLDRQEQQAAEDRAFQRAQVDAILAAGGTPAAGMVAGSGYDQTYINALRDAYLREQGERTASKGSGGGNGEQRPAGGGGDALQELADRFLAGDHSDGTIREMLEAGYTEEQLVSAGYSGSYFKRAGGGDWQAVDAIWNRGSGTGGKGSSYNTIWPRARTMFDEGKPTREIMAYLDKFSERQLTDEGLDYIMNQLNLGGYREGR